MRLQGLSDGQVVTLIVGVGLELVHRHRDGGVHGPVHPAHVRLDRAGRPHLVEVAAPPGWTPHDDWVSLLRLGRHVGSSARAGVLSWEEAGTLEGTELLRWLLAWAAPAPLPDACAEASW
jgi:hypothetical protein